MPSLQAIPLETAVPGHIRRRSWAHPEITSHSLLVLTFERLYLALATGDPNPALLAAIDAGDDLDDVLGPLAVVIDLSAVRRLQLDLTTNSLIIEYVGYGLGTSRQRITFATPEVADACFTKVWRRLGEGYQLSPHKQDAWHLARAPLRLFIGTLLATAVLVLILSIFEDSASGSAAQANLPKPPVELLLNWLDWRFVCAVGGVLVAVSQVWLYRRLTTPPASLELIRN